MGWLPALADKRIFRAPTAAMPVPTSSASMRSASARRSSRCVPTPRIAWGASPEELNATSARSMTRLLGVRLVTQVGLAIAVIGWFFQGGAGVPRSRACRCPILWQRFGRDVRYTSRTIAEHGSGLVHFVILKLLPRRLERAPERLPAVPQSATQRHRRRRVSPTHTHPVLLSNPRRSSLHRRHATRPHCTATRHPPPAVPAARHGSPIPIGGRSGWSAANRRPNSLAEFAVLTDVATLMPPPPKQSSRAR